MRAAIERGQQLDPQLIERLTATIVAAVPTGLRAPLRLRHARLLALPAAAVTLWTAVQSF